MSDQMEVDISDKEVVKTVTDLQANFELVRNAVLQFDPRLILRALRAISVFRKQLTPEVLTKVILVTDSEGAQQAILPTDSEFDAGLKLLSDAGVKSPARFAKEVPEVEIYIGVLLQVYLLDNGQHELGAKFSCALVDRIQKLDRRTMDPLSAKAYFYLSIFHEQLDGGKSTNSSAFVQIRPRLMAAYRTATLRKDLETQASVISLLLRNYLAVAHISQADAFLNCTNFPATASNSQYARFLFYRGRIQAIQLAYSDAHRDLTDATRKAPTSNATAGFYQSAMKYLIVVELLMGDIPERSIFSQSKLEKPLAPYFELVQVVRVGDTQGFQSLVEAHAATFRKDGTYSLIQRLRQSVIRIGIRRLSLSYSRISLAAIATLLGLKEEESTEYIVAKAIGDGIIEATIDNKAGVVETKQPNDVYATQEPAEAFHERVTRCLELHDECVRAMSFPMNQHRLELKNAQEARDRERELVSEIQEGDLEDDGDFGL